MNDYNTYFQIVKTSKNINEITNFVTDRLIITKSGQLYFDYSPNERIEISSTKIYLSLISFISTDKDISLNLTDIVDVNENKIDDITLNSLIFDKHGNYGIVIENLSVFNKVRVKVLGIISDFLKKDYFKKLNNKIIGNFILAKADDAVSISIDEFDIDSEELSEKKYLIKSIDETIDLNLNDNIISLDVKISDDESNILTNTPNGLLVSTYSKEEIDDLFDKVKFTHFYGPFDTLSDIPKPICSDAVYLIGDKTPYDFYVFINDVATFVGNFSLNDEFNGYTKDEIDEMVEDIYTSMDDHHNIIRI